MPHHRVGLATEVVAAAGGTTMGRGDRSWERRVVHDDDPGEAGLWAAGAAFGMTMLVSLIISGFTVVGLVVGFAIGMALLLAITSLARRSARSTHRDGPPPPLL